jgi:hypothetical protein
VVGRGIRAADDPDAWGGGRDGMDARAAKENLAERDAAVGADEHALTGRSVVPHPIGGEGDEVRGR